MGLKLIGSPAITLLALLSAMSHSLAGGHEGSADDTAIAKTLVRNVSVWNGTADSATAGQDVLVEGKLIKSIGEKLSAADATVIDGGGRVLIPGIIDAHIHLAMPIAMVEAYREDPSYVTAMSVNAARGVLMRGWTTVRDIGGPSQGLARAID